KGGREHRVPLSEPTIALLKQLPREDGSNLVLAMLRVMQRTGDDSRHAFGLQRVGSREERLLQSCHRIVPGAHGRNRRRTVIPNTRSRIRDWSGIAACRQYV